MFKKKSIRICKKKIVFPFKKMWNYAHIISVKNLKFIWKYIFKYSLSPPENPIAIKGHPPNIFSVTLNRDQYTVLLFSTLEEISKMFRLI